MDGQTLINGVLGVISALVGWFVRVLWDAQSKVRDDLAALERNLPQIYVRRDDLREWREEVMDSLRRIEQKLDGKADK